MNSDSMIKVNDKLISYLTRVQMINTRIMPRDLVTEKK